VGSEKGVKIMSRLTINKLRIENFKGIREYDLTLNGRNGRVVGENETKKTTLKDAYHWLLRDKSSDGKPSSGKGHFGLRPHYKNGNDIPGLVVMVEALLSFDGEVHALKKEQSEGKVKGKITGYPNQYYIDGAPCLKKVFDEFIDSKIPEEALRILTDTNYFCGELPYQKRRKYLVMFAENVGVPKGFDGLLSRANGQELDEYKKKLLLARDGCGNRKGYKDEQEKIPTRIEEIQIGLDQPEGDFAGTTKARDGVQAQLDELKASRISLLTNEGERQKKINRKNLLTVEQKKREADIRNDPARTKALTDEKAAIAKKLSDTENALLDAEGELRKAVNEKNGLQDDINALQGRLEKVRTRYKEAGEKTVDSTCYACKQPLPADMVKRVNEEREEELKKIEADGDKHKADIKDLTKKLEEAQQHRFKLQQEFDVGKAQFEQDRDKARERTAEIDEAIKSLPEPDFVFDEAWIRIGNDIKTLEAEIGEPVVTELEELGKQMDQAESELNTLHGILAKYDRIIQDRKRISELQAREKELAQLIADLDNEINLVMQYNLEYGKLVEEAVNERFEYVKFKLFNFQINGEIDDRVCEAMEAGTAWPDMSTGQLIKAGLDVINTMSEHLGISCPVFIDNAESVSHKLETKAQTIELYMLKGVKQLEVRSEQVNKKAVA